MERIAREISREAESRTRSAVTGNWCPFPQPRLDSSRPRTRETKAPGNGIKEINMCTHLLFKLMEFTLFCSTCGWMELLGGYSTYWTEWVIQGNRKTNIDIKLFATSDAVSVDEPRLERNYRRTYFCPLNDIAQFNAPSTRGRVTMCVYNEWCHYWNVLFHLKCPFSLCDQHRSSFVPCGIISSCHLAFLLYI